MQDYGKRAKEISAKVTYITLATVDENSPEANQRAAVAAGHECYKKRK